jgi:hypothetical protein
MKPQTTHRAGFPTSTGYSMPEMRVVARIDEWLGVSVKVRMLFDHPVLSDFAKELCRTLGQEDHACLEHRFGKDLSGLSSGAAHFPVRS